MHSAILLIAMITAPTVHTWPEAQIQVAHRYPKYKRQILSMQRPIVGFRRGIFFDPTVGKDVYGSCVLGREPEIIIGVVRDYSINRDTVVHEYKHAITFRLPLSDANLARATSWIDREAVDARPISARGAIASKARLNGKKSKRHLSSSK
jgi:hypothetical protein